MSVKTKGIALAAVIVFILTMMSSSKLAHANPKKIPLMPIITEADIEAEHDAMPKRYVTTMAPQWRLDCYGDTASCYAVVKTVELAFAAEPGHATVKPLSKDACVCSSINGTFWRIDSSVSPDALVRVEKRMIRAGYVIRHK
jgi:hypothetical protein